MDLLTWRNLERFDTVGTGGQIGVRFGWVGGCYPRGVMLSGEKLDRTKHHGD